ncbi:MAG TPA: hypothetical protein PKC43_10755 [Phycisphaerales bacterium]|nr:hypothetical protein [Phycisphaerales bacterium]HMP37915.1 hypothetical protein [Phycisphaerales bacterium]
MRIRDGSIPLPLAFLLAILLHVLLFSNLAPGIAAGGRSSHVRGELAADEIAPPRSRPPEEVALGIDAPTPSSLTWIGYDHFEEHLARLSAIDQAAFDDDPSAGAGGVIAGESPTQSTPGSAAQSQPTMTASAEAAVDAAVAAEGRPTEAEVASAATSQTEAVEPLTAAPPPLPPGEPPGSPAADETPPRLPRLDVLPESTLPAPPIPVVETLDIPTLLPSRQLLERWTSPSESASEPRDGATATGEADRSDGQEAALPGSASEARSEREQGGAAAPPTPPAEATQAGAEAPPPAPGPPVNRDRADGDDADRESDATSRVDVSPEHWRRGKPLAAHGLEIRTRRPIFPELTRLTAAPRSPVVEIFFDRSGAPRRAGIVRTSGDSRVDGPIVDALYRWRASGAPIARLGEGETIRIEMLILLSDR